MRKFREELMKSPCPNTIKGLWFKGLMPPKGDKKSNNTEGLGLFDGEEPKGEAGEWKYENEDENALFDIDSDEEITKLKWQKKHKLVKANRLTESAIT